MNVNEKIKQRRLELGLKDTEVARLSGLSIHEYFDVELHRNEIFELVDLYNIKKMCAALKLDFLKLFEMPCAFCEGEVYSKDYLLHRNQIIQKKREEVGLTVEKLAELTDCTVEAIRNLEKYTAHLESWRLEDIFKLSTVLKIPPQILLDVKCSKCGR
jgi:transcriptional regulator with XRE-family HTH domain